jgi:hypothetical protein
MILIHACKTFVGRGVYSRGRWEIEDEDRLNATENTNILGSGNNLMKDLGGVEVPEWRWSGQAETPEASRQLRRSLWSRESDKGIKIR